MDINNLNQNDLNQTFHSAIENNSMIVQRQ